MHFPNHDLIITLGCRFNFIMPKSQIAKRTAQARQRRAHTKNKLEILRQKASAPSATSSVKKEYIAALKKRTILLTYDKDRAAVRRKHLKSNIAHGKRSALEKASMLKKAKHLSYLKRRKKGRVKALRAQRRAFKKFEFIKSQLEKGKNINGW